MAIALYRKYRPKTLREVVGQPQISTTLEKAIKSDKISHSYLFIGPRGTGKTSVARIFAHAINNFNYEIEDNYIDIIEIDAASNTGVDNIRELREKAVIAPSIGKYKIYIIDEVHMLSKSAFNALLKTLEEPPAHVVFIMATTDAYKVPVTITSRSQTFTFHLADEKTMVDFLGKVAKTEKIDITTEALKLVARRGGGSFRDSLSLLDQISTLSTKKITKDTLISALGLPTDEKIDTLLQSYAISDLESLNQILRELLSSGLKSEIIAAELISKIIADPKPTLLPLLEKLPEVHAPFAEAKLLVALLNPAMKISPPSSLATHRIPSLNHHTNHFKEPTPSTTHTPPNFSSSKHPIFDKTTSEIPVTGSGLKTTEAPTSPEQLPTSMPFSWDVFLANVKDLNDAIYSQLLKTTYQFDNNTLNIYPTKKIVRTILSRENNKHVLISAGHGIKIIINEVIDSSPKDPLISQISDIMGGAEEVNQNGGEIPF